MRACLGCLVGSVVVAVGCSAPSSGAGGPESGGQPAFGGMGGVSPDASLANGGFAVGGGTPLGGSGGGVSAGGRVGSGGTAVSGGAAGAPGTGGSRPNICGTLFKDCNGDTIDGCEANTDSDANHCGACDNVCPVAANATPVCFVGACDFACVPGFGDCDGQASNGCEDDLATDAKNCGACRMDCGKFACQNGGCQCASTSVTAKESPLDIYVLFDQSGSMNQNVTGGTKWSVISGALTTFVQSAGSAGLSIGIGYFPVVLAGAPAACTVDADCNQYGPCTGGFIVGTSHLFGACALSDACQAGTYTPDVPIAMLLGVGPAIVTSLGNHGPGGGTPTYPALQGAYQYATSWATAHPNEKTIVVLATDGDPSGCDGTLNNVNTIATNLVTPALNGRPSILTFVVGVGSSLTSLNQIAAAGGTKQAFIVDAAGADPGGQFLAAMQAIKGSALLGCQYGIPNPPSGPPDYTKVNVQITPPSGAPTALKGVPNQAACAGSGGWYYDNPSAPTQIILCDTSCGTLNAMTGTTVAVLLGCGTNG